MRSVRPVAPRSKARRAALSPYPSGKMASPGPRAAAGAAQAPGPVHPHLLPPGTIVALPDGQVAVLQQPRPGLAPPGFVPLPPPPTRAAAPRPPRGGAAARAQARWVAPFVRQLHELADRPGTLVSWESCGNVLRVSDPRAFAAEVCPVYFRHRNWTSFTRMMNLYSFRMLNGTSRAVAPDHARTARFVHPHFTRDDPDRLWRVVREKRRPPAPKPKPPDASAADALLGLAAAAAAAAPAPASKRPADDTSDSADDDNQEPKRARVDLSPTCSAAQIDII